MSHPAYTTQTLPDLIQVVDVDGTEWQISWRVTSEWPLGQLELLCWRTVYRPGDPWNDYHRAHHGKLFYGRDEQEAINRLRRYAWAVGLLERKS